MPVANSRQNKHGWWGTLTLDVATEGKGKLQTGDRCIFIKTKREAHFVAEGTFVKEVRVFENVNEAKQSLSFCSKDRPSILEDLEKITVEYPGITNFVEVLKLDKQKTAPLAKKLNIYTLMLFTLDPEWMDANAEEIGKEDVLLGLSLPPMEESEGIAS